MIVERLTKPAGKPYVLESLQQHVRVRGYDWADMELVLFAAAAAEELEVYAGLALLTQTVRVTWPEWPQTPGAAVPLPIAPVIDPDTVVLTSYGETLTGFDVIKGLRPAIYLPGTPPAGRIVATYEAGFGPDVTSLPHDLFAAIQDQAAVYYDVRGARGEGEGPSNRMSAHMARVAARYRRVAL